MEKFEKISTEGLEAIKAILLDINLYKGNIKILRKRKTVHVAGPVQGPLLPDGSYNGPTSVATSTSDPIPPKQPVR
jgi:hypothetical protein